MNGSLAFMFMYKILLFKWQKKIKNKKLKYV
jgi:hypothetical protein